MRTISGRTDEQDGSLFFGDAAFAFQAHSHKFLFALAVTLTAFSIAGWMYRGPRCTFPRFVGSFYEPTIMLVGPTVAMKAIEAGILAVAG